MTDRDWIEVCVSGGELDDASYVELERQLQEAPNDIELRIKRLGFLFMNKRPRARDTLWFATHHPEIDLQGFAVFPREEDPETGA